MKLYFCIFFLCISFIIPNNALTQNTAPKTNPSPLKVGVILPLTGEGSVAGISIKNGMLMALDDLAMKDKLELIFEDDQMQATKTIAAYNLLKSKDKIDIVINVTSGTSNALAPIAEQEEVIFLAMASDPIISKDKKYVVNFLAMPREETNALPTEALARGYKNIVVITTIQQGCYALRDAFLENNQGRIKVLLNEEYPHTEKDFKPFITKLRAIPNIDAVFAVFLYGQSGIFAKQLRESGVKLPIFGSHSFEDMNELKVSNGALVGAWYANPDDPSPEFMKKYQALYPNTPYSFAPNGYDAIVLLSNALENATTKEAINTFIHTAKDIPGAQGIFSASGDNSFIFPATVKVVKENGFEKIR